MNAMREMRRKKQELGREECEKIFENGSFGVLALLSADGPYAVPLSYVYDGGKFYFHSAPEGRKIEAVKFCDRASFCVVADEVLPEKYTTKYKSAVAFGRVRILGDEEEKKAAAVRLGLKYFPAGGYAGAAAEYAKSGAHMCAIEFSVDCMTGKQGKEFLTEN